MARLFKKEINFIGNRNIFFIISATLIAISILAVCINGLKFGIEFQGGSSSTFSDTGSLTVEQMRNAFSDQGYDEAVVQNTTNNTDGTNGFIVRTTETDPTVANQTGAAVAQALSISEPEVTTIGPDWGSDVTFRSFLAFIISMIAIIIYIAIRFEYRMGFCAIASLIHDLIIVIGVYALVGREITPNVVAALLTIMGYSLYDTVVEFHRINENARNMGSLKCSFLWVANHSVNQVFTRTINTTLTSLIPVICMLIWGGATLNDFAFAMTIGLVTGTYSSFGIATPFYALWKSRILKYAKMNTRYPYDTLPKRTLKKLGIAYDASQESVIEAEAVANGLGSVAEVAAIDEAEKASEVQTVETSEAASAPASEKDAAVVDSTAAQKGAASAASAASAAKPAAAKPAAAAKSKSASTKNGKQAQATKADYRHAAAAKKKAAAAAAAAEAAAALEQERAEAAAAAQERAESIAKAATDAAAAEAESQVAQVEPPVAEAESQVAQAADTAADASLSKDE